MKKSLGVISFVLIMLMLSALACDLPGVKYPTPTAEINSQVSADILPVTLGPSRTPTGVSVNNPEYLYTPTSTETSTPVPPTLTPTPEIRWVESSGGYTVVKGDSLYNIAERYCGNSHTWVRLVNENGGDAGAILRVGQRVKVECGK